MRLLKSAKAVVALGATLIVFSGMAYAGIDSNGIAGIDSNGIAGIDSNGRSGIDSNGRSGIDSNGRSGIDSNGRSGIDSNGRSGIDSNGIGAVSFDEVLVGPVDSIDRVNGVFGSMGQIVMASQGMLSRMSVGDLVTVGGSIVGSGWIYADTVDVSSEPYVAGSTTVFVSGMLSSLDLGMGVARMGDLEIDYTSSLGNGAAPSGMMWSFSGIRPNASGALISDVTAAAK